jgi:beta-phosphoglucomutase-like phosphatase (HAD superfamily)
MAVVSSSSLRRIRACLAKAGLLKFFDDNRIFSATDLPQPSSKPDPAVYLYALDVLGAKPEECLTVEDSMSGLRAALGAELYVLGYVGSTHTVALKQEMAIQFLSAGVTAILWKWDGYMDNLVEVASRGNQNGRQQCFDCDRQ